MKKQRSLIAVIIFLSLLISGNIIILASMNTAVGSENKEAEGVLYVGGAGPYNYTSIQSAVDNATEGDTVYIHSKTYYENIEINKTINLIGENTNTTIINGNWRRVIFIGADKINITSLSIINSTSAIQFFNSNHSRITDCNIFNNQVNGIELYNSSYNQISNCNIYFNSLSGIDIMRYSHYNYITNCQFAYNGIAVSLYDCSENNISHCSISSDGGYGLHVLNASNNNIQNCILYDATGCGKAIEFLGNSDSNLVTGCEIINNYYGIIINDSQSNWNTFHHNSFRNNQIPAYDVSQNFWDDGQEGNTWDDYAGVDNNHDGIGDTSYYIPGGYNIDEYPLIIQNNDGINNTAHSTSAAPMLSTEQAIILLILIMVFFVVILFVLIKKRKDGMVKKHE